MEKELRLSVHQLVDFLLRSGDIDNRVFQRSAMVEGSRIHASFQKSQTSEYISEYHLRHEFYVEGISVILEGRADGVIKKKDGSFLIDEIKTTVIDIETYKNNNIDWHLGQAKCYALMFMLEQNLTSIGVRLTYIKQGKEKDRKHEYFYFLKAELENDVLSLIEDYLSFYNTIFSYMKRRDESIHKLKFPFLNYRKGQKTLAKYVYGVALNGGKLFCEAPTGIGKTISTLYPTIKAIENDEKCKIFYLTAKTSGKDAAYNAIETMKESGLIINDIVLTAKEKICFCPDCECNPDSCPFAKGYYEKIQSVLRYSLLNYSTFDYDTIRLIAKENIVCPFELQLDLSLFCDVIICDYNYVFDPISYLKRYFDEDATHYLALVDEAHNLIDRSKEMYSETLSYLNFLDAKKSMKHIKNVKIKRYLTKINNMFLEIKAKYTDKNVIVDNFPKESYNLLSNFVTAYQDFDFDDKKVITPELTDFYLNVFRFLKICELFNEKYVSFYEIGEKEITLNMFCLDASSFLRSMLYRLKGAVIFSATLSPIDYFIDTLGGETLVDPALSLPSPFPRKNFKIMVAPKVSIKYKDRENTYQIVADYIINFIKNKIGNYFIYCPSYDYLEKIMPLLNVEDVNLFVQTKDMHDKAKQEFLANFQENPQKTQLGLLVVGGAFGEGIDLISDRLIGAIIIGIGMPKINFKSDLIASYYKEQEKPGYDYAYIFPGMNKVMQAVGRVIRSENDRGAVLLIDERFMHRQYNDLFRNEWKHYEVVLTPKEVSDKLEIFYKD